jgi:hypothetical protein
LSGERQKFQAEVRFYKGHRVLIEKDLERTALKMLSFITPACWVNPDNRCSFFSG